MIAHRVNALDAFTARLQGVRGSRNRLRATCPACSRKGALSVTEGREGAVLVKCFAACGLAEIARAVGFSLRDLFPADDRAKMRERDAMRRQFQVDPRRALAGALEVELAKTRERLHAELGYDRPLRASDHNDARQRVARAFGIVTLPALVHAFSWETPPHDTDPAWPCLYTRALEEVTRDRWHALHPDAQPWETDPDGPGIYDRMRGERIARSWLRALSTPQTRPEA